MISNEEQVITVQEGDKMYFDELNEYIATYQPTKKTMELVDEIFKQHDSRYVDPWSHIIVAGFIANGAISVTSEIIKEPKNDKIPHIKGPQQDLKRIAAWLLRKRGFTIKCCEMRILGGIVDVIGVNKQKQILVECGPCRIDKPIDYLEGSNNTLWVLTRKCDNIVLYEITRGKNWENFLKFHKETSIKSIQEAYEKIIGDLI